MFARRLAEAAEEIMAGRDEDMSDDGGRTHAHQ
jgi:hypothetical protein